MRGRRGRAVPTVCPPAPFHLLLPQEPGSRQQYFVHTWEWRRDSQPPGCQAGEMEEGLG